MTIYGIPAMNMPTLVEKIDALNRRAVKLGVAPIVAEPTGAVWCDFKRNTLNVVTGWEVVEVDVIGGSISLPGWTFVGTLEHTEAGNILRSAPEQEIPESYRNAPRVCDHCGTVRDRKDTYIVRDADGVTRQVGHNCIRDFLGSADAQRIASWLDSVWALVHEYRENMDDETWGGRGERGALVSEIVATAYAAVRRLGGYRKSDSVGDSTAGIVSTYLWGSGKFRAEMIARLGLSITDEDTANATAAIAWVRAQTDSTGYIGNLRVAAAPVATTSRSVGLLASLPAAVERAERGAQIDAERAARQAARDAERAAERATRTEAREGRFEVTGVISAIKVQADEYSRYGGDVVKMLVKTSEGWMLWSTAPVSIAGDLVEPRDLIGETVNMTITVKRSPDDATFAFGSRPTKAVLVEAADSATAAQG